jgi:putative restriction endonuclease
MERRLPLVYFHGIVPGKYVAAWPVFVVRDDPAKLAFSVAVDDASHIGLSALASDPVDAVHEDANSGRRLYITASVRQRLHQRAFRERVLSAYRHQCAFCRLRHEELLDAAHIVPDSEPQGEPLVSNGLALCKLHHAAFDRYFLGIRPDYVIEVRPDILKEHDGPTLVHAIQALHGVRIAVPARSILKPAVGLLEVRYKRFLHARDVVPT